MSVIIGFIYRRTLKRYVDRWLDAALGEEEEFNYKGSTTP